MQRLTLLAVLMTVGMGWGLVQTAVPQDKPVQNPDATFVHGGECRGEGVWPAHG